MARFAEEMPALERLGLENFEAMAATFDRHGLDCGFERTGELQVALEPHEEGWLAEDAELLRGLGHEVDLLDGEAVRAEVRSPLYRGGRWLRTGAGILDPARLVWGLRQAILDLGVRLHERTPVLELRRTGAGVRLRTPAGAVHTERALLATSAYRPLLAEMRRRIVPVYDYVLVTEPLSESQWESIGWRRRQGIGDSANQFHYYRPTADGRILWGGYDAVYHWGNGIGPAHDQREPTFARLAQHFFATFPQLDGVRFTHRWGGAIDTCSRFFAFQEIACGGRVSYTVGHTGLGVGASRFGARVALDLLSGRQTEATTLRAMRSRPLPFPPEPLRSAVIQITRNRLSAADRNEGRRGLWLRLLDRVGLGYDS
jgi:glycine/D-amino acid oxidase-like deaminating enzyme